MPTTLSYDAAIDMWTLTAKDVVLDSEEKIDAWGAELHALYAQFEGRKSYVLFDVSRFTVALELMPKLGALVKTLTDRYMAAGLRYGSAKGLQTTSLNLQGLLHHYGTKSYPDRLSAVLELSRVRKQHAKQKKT